MSRCAWSHSLLHTRGSSAKCSWFRPDITGKAPPSLPCPHPARAPTEQGLAPVPRAPGDASWDPAPASPRASRRSSRFCFPHGDLVFAVEELGLLSPAGLLPFLGWRSSRGGSGSPVSAVRARLPHGHSTPPHLQPLLSPQPRGEEEFLALLLGWPPALSQALPAACHTTHPLFSPKTTSGGRPSPQTTYEEKNKP